MGQLWGSQKCNEADIGDNLDDRMIALILFFVPPHILAVAMELCNISTLTSMLILYM
jgi:hypothetical protein